MSDNREPLTTTRLLSDTGLAQPTQVLPEHVGMGDAAPLVMTDFECISVVLIRADDSIDKANLRMIQRGVRLLVVVDAHRNVAGLITADDILGEKPLQFIAQRGGCRHDILVQDIMTPQEQLQVLHWLDVQHARVGQIVTTLKETGRQHALVVDSNGHGRHRVRVRGMFSLSQIARQLGVSIPPREIAHNFSEIEAQLMHHARVNCATLLCGDHK